jgi:hypothetical protein
MITQPSTLGLFDRNKFPAPDSRITQGQIKDFDAITAATPAYLWLVTEGNRRMQQVDAGRAYVRVNLAGTAAGLPEAQSAQLARQTLIGAAALGAAEVEIVSDSQLLVRQMTGEYRVKNPRLAALHGEAMELAKRFSRCAFRHVAREHNEHADRLALLPAEQDDPVPARAPVADAPIATDIAANSDSTLMNSHGVSLPASTMRPSPSTMCVCGEIG